MPPHFASDTTQLSQATFKEILPGFEDFPACFKAVVPYLLASIIFHRQFLMATLPSSHPLFLSRIWTNGIMDRLQHSLHAGCGANLQTGMTATGVPPTFVIANELDSLSVRVECLQKSVLEEQHILLSTMIEKMSTLPASIGDHIRHNLEITGVVQVTVSDVTRIVNEMASTILSAIDARAQPTAVPEAIPETSNSSSSSSSAASSSGFYTSQWKLYRWRDGSEQYFAEDFTFPKCSVSLLWDLWYFGKPATRDAPFRKLTAMNIRSGSQKEILTQKTYLSKGKAVLKRIGEAAVGAQLVSRESDLLSMGYVESRSLFNNVFLDLVKSVHEVDQDELIDRLRIGEITYLRFYDVLTKPNRKKRQRQVVDDADDSL